MDTKTPLAPSPGLLAVVRGLRGAGHAASGRSEWVLGGGWQPHGWPDGPHRRLLDELLPGRPVLLRSHDLHSLWASGEAVAEYLIGACGPVDASAVMEGSAGAP